MSTSISPSLSYSFLLSSQLHNQAVSRAHASDCPSPHCRSSILSNVHFRSLSSFLYQASLTSLCGSGLHRRLYCRRGTQKFNVVKAISTFGSNRGFPQNDGSDDFVNQVVSSNPSRVEPRIMLNGEIHTLTDVQKKRIPFLEKVVNSVLKFYSKLIARVEKNKLSDLLEKGKEASTSQGEKGVEEAILQEKKVVFLKDLLREYKGNLYVPEEAFKYNLSELNDFIQEIDSAPLMTLDEFREYAQSNQVKILVSRGIRSPKDGFLYTDFLVKLHDVPGEKGFHQTTWGLRLNDQDSKRLLSWYKGPQKEIETNYSAYIEVPTKTPQLAAATISNRVVVESSVLLGLSIAVCIFAKTLATSITFAMIGIISVLTLRLLWPITMPFVLPCYWLALALGKGIWGIISALVLGIIVPTVQDGITTASDFVSSVISRGFKGIIESAMEFSELISIQFSATSIRTLSTMVLILILMATMAKFSMNRRTRNYNKWDIWQALEFAQSKSDARVEGSTGVKFEDIAGIDEIVQELKELVEYLKDPERFNTMGTKPPHGVLLEGPPGCGKTLLAKAIAGEAGVPFYQMPGSEFVEVLVGVGAARMRDLFKRAKVNKPSVVFIDEIDAVGGARGGMKEGSIDQNAYDSSIQERETTLNQLLIELDGFDTGQGVIFIGATNRMDLLDPALLRPGRFDRKIGIRPPKAQGRLQILNVHAKNYKFADSIDLWVYAKNLPGWSGAELAHLLRESALACVKRGGEVIESHDIDVALDRLTLGVERSEAQLHVNPNLMKRRAVHEVGIGMISMILREYYGAIIDPLQRLSIIPRGTTMSRTVFDRIEDELYVFESKQTLIHRMQVFLGGRAAEAVIYGRDTSPLSLLHVQDAAWLAYKMVSIFQMGEKEVMRGVNPAWNRPNNLVGPLLNFETSLYDTYGLTDCKIGRKVDDEIAAMASKLFDNTFASTVQILKDHEAAIVKAVYVLLEKKQLYSDDLRLIMDNYPPGTPVDIVENELEPSRLPEYNHDDDDNAVTELQGSIEERLDFHDDTEIRALP